jgi:hypothetical protein
MPRKITHGDKIKTGRYYKNLYERNPMIFLISKTEETIHGDAQVKESVYWWTLCRKEKGEPGEAICRSAESWPTEKACRAAINTAKKAMGGVRFAKTMVQDDA